MEDKSNEVKLSYGIGADGRLHHISEVLNGLACGCVCPGCHAPLVAKNHGGIVVPHFAHANDQSCGHSHESELHLLAKTILAEEMAVMLPAYGYVFEGCRQHFSCIEIEERNDYKMLQPDLVGIQKSVKTGRESRLWIEIKVTHKVEADKYLQIKNLGVACIEIDLLPFYNKNVNKEELKDFLLNSTEYRYWIHNPVLEKRAAEIKRQRREFAIKQQHITTQSAQPFGANNLQSHAAIPNESIPNEGTSSTAQQASALQNKMPNLLPEQAKPKEECMMCPKHSVRTLILEEMKKQQLQSCYQNLILRYPVAWFEGSIVSPHPVRSTDYVLHIGKDTFYLPTIGPDLYGNVVNEAKRKQHQRIIHFFMHTLPQMIQANGTRCDRIVKHLTDEDGKLYVLCEK